MCLRVTFSHRWRDLNMSLPIRDSASCSSLGAEILRRVWRRSCKSNHVTPSSYTVSHTALMKMTDHVQLGRKLSVMSVASHMVTNGGNPDGLF